jgi:hypothetical protein
VILPPSLNVYRVLFFISNITLIFLIKQMIKINTKS